MSISIDHPSGHDLSYSVQVCARCRRPIHREAGVHARRAWRCPSCGRRGR